MPFMTKYHILGLFYAKKNYFEWHYRHIRAANKSNISDVTSNYKGKNLFLSVCPLNTLRTVIRFCSHLAGVLLMTQGYALSNLVEFGHTNPNPRDSINKL